ncbi:MAG TPA: M20 family metallopeptidase [Pyrinomonadaceae bacterium]|nr:M20 family metallopeptidase [Pyrinomonadaceae bacterium]
MKLDPVQLLKDMVAIPSVNPMLTGTTEPVEHDMANYLEQVLRRAGIDCERQTISEGRENVIGVVHANQPSHGRKGLMFNSHMDTVPVANMTIDPFDPVVKDQLLFGRGSCDAKASIASMLTAVVAYAERSHREVPVVFAAMADEEFSFSGSWKLIEREWPVSACVIGEPTKLATVIAHKGVVRWRILVKGVSAHGATPELGLSAIYDGARVALALEAYAKELGTSRSHKLLGRSTINVGKVNGGQSVNIVPDRCEFEIERRLLPHEDGMRAVADCEKFIRNRLGDEIELQVESPYLVDPALETSSDAAIVRALGEAQRTEFGAESELQGVHYGTDGSKVSRAGIETVVCGPGDIARAHTKDEFIEIEQVGMATRLYSSLLSKFSK